MKMIIQFHDGQMTRQRVMKSHLVVAFMRDLARCGIDMSTVFVTNRHAENYPTGYLHFEYPLVGSGTAGIWGA